MTDPQEPLRIAFVVQQYGEDVNGGAETYCRVLAEHLVKRPEVGRLTVFTTCSRDYHTWRNFYPPGVSSVKGVRVERFATSFPRLSAIQSIGSLVRRVRHPDWAELPWLVAQGPFAPGLLRRLSEVEAAYDAFVFFTYLYCPTVLGLQQLSGKRILIPAAHDERAIRLQLFRRVFDLPEAIGFFTEDEQALVHRLFPNTREKRDAIIGSGVNLDGAPAEATGASDEPPFLLYLGRVDAKKGVAALALHFVRFKELHGQDTFHGRNGPFRGDALRLVIAGGGDASILPARSDVVRAGFVTEARKRELLATCEALMMPSQFESLSLVMLEAWTLERPVLVNRLCSVTHAHIERSGGGLSYGSEEEFETALLSILGDAGGAAEMGALGRNYVSKHYAWGKVEDRLLELVRSVLA